MTFPRYGQFAGYNSLAGDKIGEAPAGFSPTDVANLQAWFDARVIGSIVKDGADRVSQWDDVRGAPSGSFTQGIAASQPLWVAAGFNGEPYVRFDGIDDWLFNAIGYGIPTEYTIFQKFQRISGSLQLSYVGVGNGGSDGTHSVTGIFGFNDFRQILHGGVGGLGEAVGTFNSEVWCWNFDIGGSIDFYLDGSLTKTQASGYVAASAGATLGSGFNGSGSFGNSNIQEFIIYNRKLTAPEITLVNNYLLRV